MSDTALVPMTEDASALMERVVVGGDISKLSSSERLVYYRRLCESLGLNWLTRPFQYITLSGRLTLYATKDATEQLRKINKVSITNLANHRVEDVYVVTATARDSDGREDSATGAVQLGTMKGEALANALMKAETKAKRRVTLSICGLGMLDETEVVTIPDAKMPLVNMETGEILSSPGATVEQRVSAREETIEEEGERLFPDAPPPVVQPNGKPVELIDRAYLIGQIRGSADKAKMTTAEKADYQKKYLGGASVEKADVAALADLLNAIRTRK